MEASKVITFLSFVIIVIYVQISQGNSGCWISPPHMLDIINGSGPGWLNCTTPCRNITDFYFSDQYGYNIHTNDSIRQILGSKVPSCNGENCTISFNISWPFNDQIRNAFNSIRIHCRAIYHLGTGVQVCRTGNISINFMEATAISSALTTVTSTEIPATSNPMTTHNATLDTTPDHDSETTGNNSTCQVGTQLMYTLLYFLLALTFMYL